ncbi:MAG: hypothetical protein HS115_19485 [Spirochaetales bacterium]|nr:hypothetical protein [Spirochaetales bacterium]
MKTIEGYYRKMGIQDDSMLNRMKKRNVRIQLCLKSIDLSLYSDSSDDHPEDVEKVRQALESIYESNALLGANSGKV